MPCVHSWEVTRVAVWCVKERRMKMKRKSPLLGCFSISSFGVCLYSLKYNTTLHYQRNFALSVHCSLTLRFHNFLLLLWWELWWLHIPEHLSVHVGRRYSSTVSASIVYIGRGECGRWLAMQRRVGDHHGNLGRIPDSGERDV